MYPHCKNDQPESLLVTRKEVAELLRCSERHVSRMDKAGLMPKGIRLKRRIGYSRKQIEEWVNAGCPSLAV